MANLKVIHELTPRQFKLYQLAFQILRHHSIGILEIQNRNWTLNQPGIGLVLSEMKQVLKITSFGKYEIILSDIVSVKYKVSSISGQIDVKESERCYMLWKACIVAVDLLELLYAEILYDDSLLESDVILPKIDSEC